jgi:hypothetical protein
MERNNAWLRELIGRLSLARVLSVSHPPLVLKRQSGRACLLLSGHWKAARQLRFQSTISRFESSRPSQAVRRSENLGLTVVERPANGGLLPFDARSLGSQIRKLRGQFAESLRTLPRIFPFPGDGRRRQGSISTGWSSAHCNSPHSRPLAGGSSHFGLSK